MSTNFLLSSTSGKILISARGARILKWHVIAPNEQVIPIITAQPTIDDWFESALLFPWVNRLENGATILNGEQLKLSDYREGLHGLVYDAAYHCVYSSDEEICLQLIGERLPNFPFSFQFFVTYFLLENGLSVRFKLVNRSESDLPFAVGWHPYFSLSENAAIHFSSSKKYELDENLLPTGQFDVINESKYDFSHEVDDLHFIDNQKLTIDSDTFSLEMTSRNLPYFQLFRDKRHNGFAIEPLSGAGNCLNNKIGLISLGAREEWEGGVDTSIQFKS
jgi:aldose 1-epimerase